MHTFLMLFYRHFFFIAVDIAAAVAAVVDLECASIRSTRVFLFLLHILFNIFTFAFYLFKVPKRVERSNLFEHLFLLI